MNNFNRFHLGLFTLPGALLSLTGCDQEQSQAPQESAQTASVPASDEPAATVAGDTPDAQSAMPAVVTGEQPAGNTSFPKRQTRPTPGVNNPASKPTASPTLTPTETSDPHAGHDMSTMSDEDMKAMGHN